MSEYSKCFGYVNETHKEMEEKGIKYAQDCKICLLLESCVAYYNSRSYSGPWDDSLDPDEEELLTDSLFEDDDYE